MFSEYRFRKKAKDAAKKRVERKHVCHSCNEFGGHWEGDHFVECSTCWGEGRL